MTNNVVAIEHYSKAKTDLKRDFMVCLIFSIVFAVIISVVLFFFALNTQAIPKRLVASLLLGSLGGIYLTCIIFSMVFVFKFAWNRFSFISIFIIIVLYAFAAAYAPIITIIKLVRGHVKIKKLEKILGIK